jgi:hypothetical protein
VPRLDPRQPPPPDYYAGNLDFVLSEVARRNADLLGPRESALIDAWGAASGPARRLLARLLSRRGPWIRVDRLQYPEVPLLCGTLAELERLGLVEIDPAAPADRLLDLFTRAELRAVFPDGRADRKRDWVRDCLGRYTDAAVRARLARHHSWIGVAAAEPFAVCRLLFFGSDRRDLTEFVLQDLGVQRFEHYEIGTHTRPFNDRAEIDRYAGCRRMAAWLAECEDDPQVPAAIRRALWQPEASRTVARLRDRVLNRIGQLHERRGEYDEALESYALSRSHPARERRARLLLRLGDRIGAMALMNEALAAPWAAEEEDYALRCLNGAAQARAGSAFVVTEEPLDATAFAERTDTSIEDHALRALTCEGGVGWHLENHFPLGLAGLLFWHEIFGPAPAAFSHPFQHGPRDLFWPDFARVRWPAILARSRVLEAPAAFRAHLARTVAEKQGISNHLVHWGVWTPNLVESLLAVADTGRLLALARHVIGDLQRARTGFPDLLIIRGRDAFEFVEVKSPTDQLQPAQRTWLRALQRMGLPARVLRYRA